MRLIKHFLEWLVSGLQGGDYVLFAFFILAIILAVFFIVKWRKQSKFQRAEFAAKLLEKMRTDSEIQSFIKKIEAEEEWYNDTFSQDMELQREVFHVLSFYNYICYLEENHVISTDEFMLFEFSIQRLAVNDSFQNYMFQLFHKTEEEHQMFPFYFLLDSCAEKMPGGFLDGKSENYKKIKWEKKK